MADFVKDKRNAIQKLFGFCPQCGHWLRKVKTMRQNTAYVDDELNYFTGCKGCQDRNAEYWDEMWNQYYNSVGGTMYG